LTVSSSSRPPPWRGSQVTVSPARARTGSARSPSLAYSSQTVAAVSPAASSRLLTAGREAASPTAKTCRGRGSGQRKPLPCTVAAMVSPAAAALAQRAAHPSCSANTRSNSPVAGSASTRV
jgi:hypothetical protein